MLNEVDARQLYNEVVVLLGRWSHFDRGLSPSNEARALLRLEDSIEELRGLVTMIAQYVDEE